MSFPTPPPLESMSMTLKPMMDELKTIQEGMYPLEDTRITKFIKIIQDQQNLVDSLETENRELKLCLDKKTNLNNVNINIESFVKWYKEIALPSKTGYINLPPASNRATLYASIDKFTPGETMLIYLSSVMNQSGMIVLEFDERLFLLNNCNCILADFFAQRKNVVSANRCLAGLSPLWK